MKFAFFQCGPFEGVAKNLEILEIKVKEAHEKGIYNII